MAQFTTDLDWKRFFQCSRTSFQLIIPSPTNGALPGDSGMPTSVVFTVTERCFKNRFRHCLFPVQFLVLVMNAPSCSVYGMRQSFLSGPQFPTASTGEQLDWRSQEPQTQRRSSLTGASQPLRYELTGR